MASNNHKKTGITEFAALATLFFTLYQGHKHGAINPDVIGQIILSLYDWVMIVIPPLLLSVRMAYKKWIRKPVKKSEPDSFKCHRERYKDDT